MDKPDVDYRGAVSGGVHRPEVDQPQPTIDGRTITEVYGLPAAVVCARARRTADLRERVARKPRNKSSIALAMPEGTRFLVLAPVVRTARASSPICSISSTPRATAGAGRRCVHPLTDPPKLKAGKARHRGGGPSRSSRPPSGVTDSVETALNLADGIVVLEFVDPRTASRAAAFSPEKLACPTRWPSTT